MRQLTLGLLGALWLVSGIDLVAGQEKKTEKKVPPIDKNQPEKIETATLALG